MYRYTDTMGRIETEAEAETEAEIERSDKRNEETISKE